MGVIKHEWTRPGRWLQRRPLLVERGPASSCAVQELKVPRCRHVVHIFAFFHPENPPARASLAIHKIKHQRELGKETRLTASGDDPDEGVALPFMTSQRADFQNGALSGKAEAAERGKDKLFPH